MQNKGYLINKFMSYLLNENYEEIAQHSEHYANYYISFFISSHNLSLIDNAATALMHTLELQTYTYSGGINSNIYITFFFD